MACWYLAATVRAIGCHLRRPQSDKESMSQGDCTHTCNSTCPLLLDVPCDKEMEPRRGRVGTLSGEGGGGVALRCICKTNRVTFFPVHPQIFPWLWPMHVAPFKTARGKNKWIKGKYKQRPPWVCAILDLTKQLFLISTKILSRLNNLIGCTLPSAGPYVYVSLHLLLFFLFSFSFFFCWHKFALNDLFVKIRVAGNDSQSQQIWKKSI